MKAEYTQLLREAKEEYQLCLDHEDFDSVELEATIKESPKGNNITVNLTAKIKVIR